MLAPVGKVYISEDVEIDTGRVEVRRGGQIRSLRPKSFQLLQYLIENRDRLIPKEELIEQLWGGDVVSDGSLAQCVTDLRKALDDNPRNPRYIRTAPRLGYQFIGPVDCPGQSPAAPPAVVPGTTRWKWFALAFGLTLVAVFAAALAPGEFWLPGLTPKTSEAGIRTAVLPFENRSGSADLDWLRIGLADMLTTSLSSSPRIAVASPTQLQRELKRIAASPASQEDSLRAGKATGARIVVLGAFASAGKTIRLDAQIYDAPTGKLIGGESLTAEDPAKLLAQLDGLAARIGARLGAPLPAQTRLAEVVTNNLEAYRLYSMGIGLTRALRLREAIALYERAAALDPKFAMANARVGYAYSVAWGQTEKGKPYLERAYREIDRLTPRDRMFIRAWYAMAPRTTLAPNAPIVKSCRHFRLRSKSTSVWRLYYRATAAWSRPGRSSNAGLRWNPKCPTSITCYLACMSIWASRIRGSSAPGTMWN